MVDETPMPALPLQLIESDPDGYCDPVTGVCAVPGAAKPEPTADDGNRDGGISSD
ncbi:hypothetical protein ITP53_07060 [Nonomuraea sp. K274]|uniref:Uncharacterized protein n=1 Tax=Nonomuraea cypriaca TaxID=1187855 RepID=A0A931A3D3_9ACTN|nr:hypothetical protein [Nonomuraea cypriaca]MBF8185502.1 hypothetical protein [Nonomuraea cypriaca]